MAERVDDPEDPRLAEYVDLRDPDLRRRVEPDGGFFVAESPHVIRTVIGAGRRVRSVLVTPIQHDALASTLATISAPVYVADPTVLRRVVGFDLHRGAVASVDRWPLPSARDVCETSRRVAVLERVNDHENLGVLFRCAAAFGLDAVLLDAECSDPLYRRTVRVSIGHVCTVPWTRYEHLHDLELPLVALTPNADAIPIDEVEWPDRCALMLGAEGPGLSKAALAAADVAVRIPMRSDVDSLNVATAAAIAFHLLRADTVAEMVPQVTAEYHVHLEGSMRPATLRKLAARHGITLSERFAGDTIELAGFDDFLMCFLLGQEPLLTAEDFSDAVAAYAQELADQGVSYVEMTTTAYVHHLRGIPRSEYTEGLADGRRRAAALGVDVRWIVDIPRNAELPEVGYTADFVCGADAPEGTIAIGLGGNERDTPAQLWMDSFDRARAAGLLVVLHAGETQGPESVWNALECRADRIGHGISCVRDDELVRRLVDEQIMLEVCPTSNVKTRVVRSYDEHPVHEMIARGLHVTINSDDPGYFGASLSEEVAWVNSASKPSG